MQLKPKNWNCLRFVGSGDVIGEAVADVMRGRCPCGDGVWWRIRPEQEWRCRTCRPVNANQKVFWLRRKKVVDPTEAEIAAIQAASEPAGEYLDSLGKTDLATLAEDEWLCLLEVVVTAFQDKLRELAG